MAFKYFHLPTQVGSLFIKAIEPINNWTYYLKNAWWKWGGKQITKAEKARQFLLKENMMENIMTKLVLLLLLT